MSSYDEMISEAISEHVKRTLDTIDQQNVIVGTVSSLSVDPTTGQQYCTVTPIDTNLSEIGNVLLTSDSGAKPIFVPALNSTVTVNLFSKSSGYIAQHGKIATTTLSPGAINYGGIVIVADVVTRLNNIENFLNTFINTIFNVHTHAVPSLGTSATPLPTEGNNLILTVNSDLVGQNPVTTHGSGSAANTSYAAQLASIQAQIDTVTFNNNNIAEQLLVERKKLEGINQNNNLTQYSQVSKTITLLRESYDAGVVLFNSLKQQQDSLKANPQ